jgi:hypothetical protein
MLRLVAISISHSDSGGEGTHEYPIAHLAGTNTQPLKELQAEFHAETDQGKNIYRKSDHNDDRYDFNCYRIAFPEQFVAWLIEKKGFIEVKVENRTFDVITPREEKYLSENWLPPAPNDFEAAPGDDVAAQLVAEKLLDDRSKVRQWLKEGNVFSTLEPAE